MSNDVLKWVAYGDIHAPYHSQGALDLACNVAHHFKPDLSVVMGDTLDAYCVSEFDKDPARISLLAEESGVARACLTQIRDASPKHCNHRFVGGNHEYRIPRWVAKHAKPLYGRVTIEKELDLEGLGYRYTPYKQSFRFGKLTFTHDLNKCGPTAYQYAAGIVGTNVLIGHVHTAGIHYSGNMRERHVGFAVGWLGDPLKVDYKHRDLALTAWQHGLAYGYTEVKTGFSVCHFVPFVKGKALMNGKVIR